ncbi:Beta-glucuronidase [Klebsiella pneumoniae]|nr:Beta-glucuronidase [Klebsiella pneumoniae]
MLRPVETSTREIKKLDGLWSFCLDTADCGMAQQWWKRPLSQSRAIAVPGSFNDQFADADIRNYVGNVWYQRQGNDSNLLIVFYVQIMPDDFVMQLHRF